MNDARLSCRSVPPAWLRGRVRALSVAVLLVVCGGVWAQTNVANPATGIPDLIKQQGQQKQRLIQGQAATQLSQSQAKRLAASAPRPAFSQQQSMPPQQPVSAAAVQLKRAQRIRRLNAAKVAPAVTP
ncbi:hypothetical protein [Rhodoferax sp.]|uniref:hypothetical protein n=1 Tax=Rhodoferax sp. TaxID=50421 RepID=UPI002851C635|nr:hypothetical protein [Rhodoferax sp.]MDR3367782.1 hypothetical protein [Rhodoferax sp.]